jgi:hypothetical protein
MHHMLSRNLFTEKQRLHPPARTPITAISWKVDRSHRRRTWPVHCIPQKGIW